MAIRIVYGDPRLSGLEAEKPILVVVAGSTLTSTIPGISIAGPTPEATLYTPTLDVEYLVAGKPLTLDVVPVAPNGVPTPALISRAISVKLGTPVLIVDAGCRYPPRIPAIALPSRRVGGRIDSEDALPRGTSEKLFKEARILGRQLARIRRPILVGETIPGGTTTAAAILEALGLPGLRYVSSSSPSNPRSIKKTVIAEAMKRLKDRHVFHVNDVLGDPVHVSIAGIAAGVMDAGGVVYLAGGTQMAAVAAILSRLGYSLENTAILTTRWIAEDRDAGFEKLVRLLGIAAAAADISFSNSSIRGLRLYDEGYAKEGVAAGGMLVTALLHGLKPDEVVRLVEEEYRRLLPNSRG